MTRSSHDRVRRAAGLIVAAVGGGWLCPAAFGQTSVSFVGASGGFWHTPVNWQPQVVPDNDLGSMFPVSYTVSIDRNVLIAGTLFDISGMTNAGSVDTFTSWDFQAGIGSGAPFLLNTGTVSIVPTVNTSAFISVANGNTLTTTGGGAFVLGGAGLARVLGGGTLVNTDNTIRGEGSFGEGVLSIVNNATIAANEAGPGSPGLLTVFAGPGGLTNSNTLQARNNATLSLRGTINNAGGTIIADAGGTVVLGLVDITEGTITSAASGSVLVNNNTTWNGPLTHTGRTFVADDLTLIGNITNTGSINVTGAIRIATGAALNDSGTITLTNGAINRVGTGSATLTTSNFITGTGNIGVGSLTITNVDSGIIQATGGTLSVDPGPNGQFFNAGELRAVGGGILSLASNGQFFNGMGNIHAAPGSTVSLNSARIAGGSVSTSGSGVIRVPIANTARLNNVDVDARIVVESGANLELQNAIGSGIGTMEIIGGASLRIVSAATASLGNVTMRPGSFLRAASGSFDKAGGPEASPIFYNEGLIRGAGTISANDLQLINNGTFMADGGGVGLSNPLSFDPAAEGLLNAGLIEAIDLGVVTLNGGTGGFTQTADGIIRATDPGSNVRAINAHIAGGQLGAGGGSFTTSGGGTVTFEALASDANVVQSGVGTLRILANVLNTGTITIPTVATLSVSGGSTLNSASGHHINQGTIAIAGFADFNFVENVSTITIGRIALSSNALMQAHSIDQGTLSLANDSFATLKSSFAPGVDGSIVNSLSIGTMNAALDLTNRGLAVNYFGASPLTSIAGWIATGRAGGAWTGPGIRSSTAAADGRFAIGYAEASQIGSPATFLGRAIDSTTVLIRTTYAGDANLSGGVNLDDFTRLAAGFGTGTIWSQGDFNYDGVVNLDDFTALAANFGQTLPADAARSAVPEPAGVVFPVLTALGCLRRSRR